ncbi:murein hydrolase activator EnvC family protein [Tropicimonas sp. S265A]|uniref:murein hydrolase activator EnvC family protein n=1 Tax=Tropicimonas sp. S265A TaxID=3415134 RepID=UPI003C7AFCD2
MRAAIRLIAVLTCLGASPVMAQAPGDAVARADDAVGQLDRARALLEAAPTAPDRVAALTEAVRGFEAGLAAIRESTRAAVIRETAILDGLAAEQARLAELLGVLQTISRTPDPVLLIHPEGPLGLARAGMMVSEVTPAVAAEAERLNARLTELEDVRAVQSQAEDRLEQGLTDIQTARAQLAAVVAERVRLPDGPAADPVLLGVLSASSTSLREFADSLAALELPTVEGPAFEVAKGRLPLPLSGLPLRGFDEPDLAGVVRPGWVIAASGQALVTTPSAATVRYVGTLLDYGNVIVLEPQAEYLLILAGIENLYVQAGEVVPEGAPLGLMGGTTPAFDRTEGGQTRKETLYMELRHNGEPVDPAEWFVTDAIPSE